MQADNYTKYPRPLLWLIREGTLETHEGRFEIEPFYLSKSPVTNRQFEAHDPHHERTDRCPGDDDAVTGVTLEQARAYCAWYARVSRKAMRLPTELEWEYAWRDASSFGLLGLADDGIAEWIDDDRGVVRRAPTGRRDILGSPTRRDDLGFRLSRSLRGT